MLFEAEDAFFFQNELTSKLKELSKIIKTIEQSPSQIPRIKKHVMLASLQNQVDQNMDEDEAYYEEEDGEITAHGHWRSNSSPFLNTH